MAFVHITAWIIVGSVAAWLVATLAGRGPLGFVVDWVAALVGALLGGFLLAPGIAFVWAQLFGPRQADGSAQPWNFGQDVGWWVTVPVAFASALALSYIYRSVLRARTSP
jgi:uncharacterized membrane protein YeaQ/YmgE (transglycosylase-associated protein family)